MLYVELSAPDDADKVGWGISGVEGLRASVVQLGSAARCGVGDVGAACCIGISGAPDGEPRGRLVRIGFFR